MAPCRCFVDTTDWPRLIRSLPGYDPYRESAGFYFDEKAAELVRDFYTTYLKHVKGEWAGQSFVLANWQLATLGNLFGWKSKTTGLRRFREAFVFVPRKNGKTALVAGLALFVLFCDKEPGAELYSAAADREQAALVYFHAKGMVQQSPELSKRGRIYGGIGQRSIVYEETGSSYKVISADAATKHGYNSHLVIVDELHALPNRELVDVLQTSTGARRQPLIVHITTSDFDRPSICNEKLDRACKIRDGIINDAAFLPVVYQGSLDDDWTDEEVWKRVNPNYGVSLSRDYLVRECEHAKESVAYLNTFLRLHLNVKTSQDVVLYRLGDWDACLGNVDLAELNGLPCFGGLDLASKIDLSAFVLLFPRVGEKRNVVLPFFWAPQERARERSLRDRVEYLTWAQQGHLKLTKGNITDYDVIRNDIVTLGKRYNIREIAIDRWNSTQLQTQLAGAGFEIVQFGQGFVSMSDPTKELEALLLGRTLVQDGHPILRWNVSNAAGETNAAGDLKPAKDKSSEKIDGVVALIMALGQAIKSPPNPESPYEQHGLRTL